MTKIASTHTRIASFYGPTTQRLLPETWELLAMENQDALVQRSPDIAGCHLIQYAQMAEYTEINRFVFCENLPKKKPRFKLRLHLLIRACLLMSLKLWGLLVLR